MNVSSYKGKILISTPDASKDIFSRSVVLIIENNKEGSFGLVLNKKNNELSFKVSQIIDHQFDVYIGGPVENDKIFFIVKDVKVTESFKNIDDVFYLTEDIEAVVTAILEQGLPTDSVKIFSGYAGWEPNQLEFEISNKFWKVVESYELDLSQNFENDLWKNIMENLGGSYLIFSNSPEDTSLN